MKRIYVAGASAELDLVRGYIEQLIAAGWNVTYDWTEAVAKFGSAGAELTEKERRGFALLDLEGVRHADVFWMLAPQNHSVGAWIELGAALTAKELHGNMRHGEKPDVVVSGTTDSIFALLADKRFATHDEALGWLIGGMP